jgi:hypothetical protein
MLIPSLPVRDRTQTGIQRFTRLWKATPLNFSHWEASAGKMYTLFPGNCHPFPEDMAPDPPSSPLNALSSSIRFASYMKGYHIMRPLYPWHTRRSRLYFGHKKGTSYLFLSILLALICMLTTPSGHSSFQLLMILMNMAACNCMLRLSCAAQ